MRILADTHVVLWMLADPDRIAARCRRALEARDNEVYVSAASIWEAGIKRRLKKLSWEGDLVADIATTGITFLDLSPRHAAVAGDLPLHHRDPFDHALIAQALLDGLTLATREHVLFGRYGVDVLAA